jgi:GxxExxY protein
LRGLSFKEQVPLPLLYKGLAVGIGYRVDFVVENELVIELKTVEKLLPQHCSQVLTYLRLLDLPQGFLMNFSVGRLADGIKSILNPRATRAPKPI